MLQGLTYLDFCLANADTSALEAHLQAEQKAEPPGRFKTISRDYPVEVFSLLDNCEDQFTTAVPVKDIVLVKQCSR